MTNTFPQLFDLFKHDGREYRVDGFLKTVEMTGPVETDGCAQITFDIRKRLNGGNNPKHQYWCSAEEAELVSGVGIRGIFLKVEEVHVIGRVDWSDNFMTEQTDMYSQRYLGQHQNM